MTVFRPEVQALRALAVASVVAYHLYPNRLTGGYVGVDVFFVISGFLITSHLVASPHRPALREFWARRIRRLLPAASVVLLASFAAMLGFVPQSLWQRTVTEIGASALYVQNWVLGSNSVDYLAADGTATLVQHFWSLSVEEQFYLVWPLLISVAMLLPRRRVSLPIVLGAVFLASLVWSHLSVASPASYFSTATRAWEFAAGGLLALAPVVLPAVASWLGVALITFAAVAYTPATPFPGVFALVPVVGTLLVIAGRGRGMTRLVALRPVQVVGDLSYAIYLWHWPLITVLPYATGHNLTTVEKIGIVLVSVALAALTKRFIEDPVRRVRRKRLLPSYGFAAVAVGIIVIASSSTWLTVQAGADAAAASVAEASVTDDCFGASAMVTQGCDDPFAVPASFDSAFWAADKGSLGTCNSTGTAVTMCAFGDTVDPVHTVALIGNSHAGHLVAALETYGKANGFKVVLMRKTGCTGATTEKVIEPMKQPCVDWSKSVRAAILDPSNGIDVVAFASNNDSDHYVAGRALTVSEQSVVTTQIAGNLADLAAAGKSVVVFGDVPGAVPTVVPECVDLHSAEYDPCSTRRAAGDEYDDFVAAAARSVAAVHYVDLMPYFCDATRCHVMIGGAVVYIDEHHLTASYSRSLAPYLGAALERALAP